VIRVPRNEASAKIVHAMVENEVAPLFIGQDPSHVRELHDRAVSRTVAPESKEQFLFAIAAVDAALWDLLGRAAGMPCHRLWGTQRDRVPAYAMVGWLNLNLDEIKANCERALRLGFHNMKLKVGSSTLEADVERVTAARAVLGKDAKLMVDANEAHTVDEALRRGRAFSELGCFWFEEPIAAHDFDGYAELVRRLPIPVAAGENLLGFDEIKDFVTRTGVRIVQPEYRRVGGPTAMMQIAEWVAQRDLSWCSHGGGPVNLNLLCALPNAAWFETGFGDGRHPHVEQGHALAPRGAGFAWEEPAPGSLSRSRLA